MIEYNVKSEHAAEFIHDGEIRSTLQYAIEHKNDKALIEEILAKAELGKGISHREAAVLIEVEDKEIEARMYSILPPPEKALIAGSQKNAGSSEKNRLSSRLAPM